MSAIASSQDTQVFLRASFSIRSLKVRGFSGVDRCHKYRLQYLPPRFSKLPKHTDHLSSSRAGKQWNSVMASFRERLLAEVHSPAMSTDEWIGRARTYQCRKWEKSSFLWRCKKKNNCPLTTGFPSNLNIFKGLVQDWKDFFD